MAMLYVTLTSGVMVNIHYCMGRLSSVDYGHESTRGCDKCGMEQKKGCCHTEHKLIKADQEHLAVNSLPSLSEWIAEASPVYSFFPDYNYRNRDHHYSRYHSPPDPRAESIHVYNCVFRV